MMGKRRSSNARLSVERLEDRLTPTSGADLFEYGPLAPQKLPGSFAQTHVANELLVALRPEVGADQLNQIIRQDRQLARWVDTAAAQVLTNDPDQQLVKLQLTARAPLVEARERLATLRAVQFVQPNFLYAPTLTPNDPEYGSQYHLTKIQADLAWDTNAGSSDVIVAVTDTGTLTTHPDLVNNLWVNGDDVAGNGIDDDNNGFIDDRLGWDFANNNNNPSPGGVGGANANDHGVHVAGIVAATTNNATGVAGIAGGNGVSGSGARVMAIQWSNSSVSTSNVILGFRYAVDNGAKIITTSFDFDGLANDAGVLGAYEYGYSRGVLYLLASGNDNTLNNSAQLFTHPLIIASTDANDNRSSFSNYGVGVDVSAPGTSIRATTGGTTPSYGVKSGTSMATPAAAAVAALIWSQNPTWTRDQVVQQLLTSADTIAATGMGSGRVNAFKGVTQTPGLSKVSGVVNLPANNGTTSAVFSTIGVTTYGRLDPASVQLKQFDLRTDGADNLFDTPDDVIVPMSFVNSTYRVGTNSLDLAFASPLAPERYRLAVNGNGLRDPFGRVFDGDGNGVTGGSYFHTFTVSYQVSGRTYADYNGNGNYDFGEPALAGVNVFSDMNTNGTRDTGTTAPTTGTGFSQAISDNNVSNFVDLAVSGQPGVVSDVNVRVSITHPRNQDLDVWLVSPAGTRIELFTDVGADTANFTNTILDGSAFTSITGGTAPFTGTFRPEGNLASFNGQLPNGTWRLEVRDDTTNGQTGTITAFRIDLATAEPQATSGSSGVFVFAGLLNGATTVRASTPSGQTATGPVGGTYAFTVASGGTYPDRNFGFTATGPAVQGRVFRDDNNNLVADTGEPGLSERQVYLDTNGNGTLDGGILTKAATIPTPLNIPDNNPTGVSSTLTVSGATGPITDLEITLNVTHSYVGDLEFRLTSPSGTTVNILDNLGGSQDNLVNTILDDEASTAFSGGLAPWTGRFRPSNLLSAFDGLTANGTWTLQVVDSFNTDVGTLNGWSLAIANGEASALTDTNGNYRITSSAGTQKVALVGQTGWTTTAPASGFHSATVGTGPVNGLNFAQRPTDTTPPTLTTTVIGDGTAQRSRVLGVELRFSEPIAFVGVPQTALTLTGPSGAVPFDVTLTNTGGIGILALTFTGATVHGGSLPNGLYTLTVGTDRLADLFGNRSGTLAPINFHRLYGDSDGDRNVGLEDLLAFRAAYGGVNLGFDADNDGVIGLEDLLAFRAAYGTSI